jgi:hypothetical protein
MFNKLIKYIITLLLSIIVFCIIPKEFNPIANIYLFVLLGLLIIYFVDTCSLFEYFNIDNKNIKDLSNNNFINENDMIFEDDETKKNKEASIKIQKLIQDRVDEIKNIKLSNQIEQPMYKDISNNPNPNPNHEPNTNNCKNNDKLILLNNVHDNIQNLVLPYLENIVYNNNTIKIKSQITDIILSIKHKNEPYEIYSKVDNLAKLLKDSDSELYDLFNHISLILNSIIYQKPIDLNSNIITGVSQEKSDSIKSLPVHSDIIPDVSNNSYIKKHFSPLFEKLLLVILSYNKLPNKLQYDIKYIINLIDNDANVNNIFKKIKEINNDISTVLNDKQIISDKVAKTYLLMSKTTLDVIIKNYKLIILQEPLEIKSDILKLNKDMETIMKTHLGKILKLIISLEYNSLDDSNVKTYLLVDFNSAIENATINNDSSNTQISDMLKQLANKLETSNNECNCENKVNEAVEKYLKNGKYIDDNGIIKNIMNSDMIYNQLDISMLQSLGSYDNSFSNKWDKGYTYLDTSKWSVPKVHIPPPPNINNIQSSLTPGYPINVLEFDNSRKVLGPDNINLQYIKEKLN